MWFDNPEPLTDRAFLQAIPDLEGSSIYLHEIAASLNETYGAVIKKAYDMADYVRLDITTIPPGKGPEYISVSHRLKSLSYLIYLQESEQAPDTVYYAPIRRDATSKASPFANRHFVHAKGDRYEWMVTGTASEKLSERCGHIKRVGACADHPEHTQSIRTLRFGCKDSLCPTCWSSRAARTKADIVDRLIGGFQSYQKQGAYFGSIQDFSFHPPLELGLKYIGSYEGVKKLKEQAKVIFEKAGLTGGVMILHPWRVDPDAKEEYREDKKNGFQRYSEKNPKKQTEKLGIWMWLRGMQMLTSDNIHFSPHFHVQAVVGGHLKPSDIFYNETGWTYKHTMKDKEAVRWRADKTGDWTEARDNMEAKIFYILSHTGIMYDNQDKKRPLLNINWFGLFSSQKLKCTRGSPEFTPVRCPVCDAAIVEYDHFDVYLDECGEWEPDLEGAVPTCEPWCEVHVPKSFLVR